ncbi:MAG: tRNA pseudouridine(38-40) synthase TruA [Chloroflexi bacterium]|nr:tRNA pseudouridine(38-40) synthase TruA [Chloroflexota bacterium]
MTSADATPYQQPRIVLFIEYEGTRYRGFQAQRAGPTVQGTLEDALERLTAHRYRVRAASRTDAGVHALGQVVSFVPQTEMALSAYEAGLNHYLPRDIAVTAAFWAPPGLDVRRSAVARTYRYAILNRRARSPRWERWAAHVREPLDVDRMAQAATVLYGWLDMRPFTGPLEPHRSALRRLDRLEVRRDGALVTIEIEASSFLPHQVRRIAGALVEVGKGRLSQEEFHRLVGSGVPGEAHWTMPPQGLCLVRVCYDGFPPTDEDERCRR